MTVRELIEELKKVNQDGEILINREYGIDLVTVGFGSTVSVESNDVQTIMTNDEDRTSTLEEDVKNLEEEIKNLEDENSDLKARIEELEGSDADVLSAALDNTCQVLQANSNLVINDGILSLRSVDAETWRKWAIESAKEKGDEKSN